MNDWETVETKAEASIPWDTQMTKAEASKKLTEATRVMDAARKVLANTQREWRKAQENFIEATIRESKEVKEEQQ